MAEHSSDDTRVSILRVVHQRPAITIPPGACDCHVHVFGPTERFPIRRRGPIPRRQRWSRT